jgi:hypothetical protein
MTKMITSTVNTNEHKITAAQVEKECPDALQDLGKRIATHLEKARKCEEKTEQHYTAVAQLLAKAEEACDDGGFTAFCERFFPDLGKTRVYELLQIATNKTSVEQVRAKGRKRQAKSRANKKEAMANSVTVTEKSEPAAQEASTDGAPADALCTASIGNTVQPKMAASRKVAPRAKDIALEEFTGHVARLLQMIKGAKPHRFIDTGIKPEGLATLSSYLSNTAKAKEKPNFVPQGTAELSPAQSAEDMKAKHAARDTAENQAA